MRGSFRIATIRGIEIGIHYSWVLVFVVVAWTLAVGLFPFQYPGLGTGTYWIMGFAASLLLFVSVLIHELAHSFVAQGRGLRVASITLFVFGGVSNISGEPSTAQDELLISAVGPLSSLALGGIFWGIWLAIGDGGGAVQGVIFYLAIINALLAGFNLIPGFPLDGGRVFRAIVWWYTGRFDTATRIAVTVGHGVAFLFILAGIFFIFVGAFISGIWLILVGWFLNSAAEASSRETQRAQWFRGITVRQAMNPHPVVVESEMTLAEVVHDHILQRAVRSIPVVSGERLMGMLTLNEVSDVPHEQWNATLVRDVMTPLDQLQTVGPDQPLDDAFQLLAEHDVNQLPVVQNGGLIGLLSRSDLMRLMQVRQELGVPDEDEDQQRAA